MGLFRLIRGKAKKDDAPPAGISVKLEDGSVIRLSAEEAANPDFQAGMKAASEGRGGSSDGKWDSAAFQLGWWVEIARDGYFEGIPFAKRDIGRIFHSVKKKPLLSVVPICADEENQPV